MKLTDLEIHCLNCLCDDYENLHAIIGQLKADTGREYSKREVLTCLERLTNNGLVTKFSFNVKSSKYLEDEQADVETSWFLISSFGRKQLDTNWKGGNG